MRKLLSYLKPYVPKMILGLIIKFTGTIMDLLLPWTLSHTIDNVIPQKNVTLIFIWGGIMIFSAIAAWITNIVANRMASRVARDTTQAVRHDLFEKIIYLSCRQADEFTIPSLQSRLTSDTYNIHQMIGMMQRLGVRAPILLIGGILMTLMLEPVLSLIMILTLPIIGLLVYLVSKKGIPYYTALQRSVDMLVRTVRESITGIRVIKALSKTDYEKSRFFGVNSEVVKAEKKAGITMAVTNPAMNLLMNIGLTLVIAAGAVRVNAGLTQSGEIIAFLTYFTLISNAMLSITRMFVIYTKGSASAERIRQVLESPEDLKTELENHVENGYHITFENVTFNYNKSAADKCANGKNPEEKDPVQRNCIEDISFALKKGETLGIIGATGSGKSTIIRLLLRFYDPDEGQIRISGDDIRSIPQQELHSKFGVVFQNDFLMADTIASNISFGRGLSEEQIETAAECAQAKEFIDALPDRYRHLLEMKSANLSGGQKQRILIARALAANPEILILDDSSSALDYRTDALLRKSLARQFSRTTTIIIAQRISSIMHADHIMILENGRALGYGTHEELLGSCGVYREICLSQMGGEAIA